MAKGQPKKKKAKKDVFTVYFNYDGIFTSFLLKYSQGQMKELNDTNFDENVIARIMFRGTAEHHETETPLVDPDENQIDAVNKVQSGVHYPAFNPGIPWDKMG
ncbi:hypothetical protein Tco_0247936 [Tanacetum coccineum]